ncbi:TCR/Tet family MFS transporter [Maricaulis sp.]|uniref:TCR/Tet family MFS transporter n=1 Tax=Maricaulis sp. TaxID=1486257 RepID=UPI001B0E7C92|nr:TCR/Tet family MFS transporter [Maricaulis sp.]MBO6795694.1 TCR/Tet family MFS transporter [Maricaulis sp.]
MSARQPGKHAITFIFITVLIDMIGFGLIIPVMPELINELTGLGADDAAVLGAWLMMTYALTQFIFAPIVGALSDRFGRKPVLLAALAGFTIDYAIMGFAPFFWMLVVGRLLAGIFGASYSTANAYIADITPPEKRAGRFGMIGAAFGLGFIIGPAVGGILGDLYGPRAPFFAAAILAGLNLVYGLIVLPETLAPENRRKFDWKRANPFGALIQIRKYPAVFSLIFAVSLMLLGHAVFPAIWSYYTAYKFDWDAGDIGFSLMVVGITAAIVQGGLTRVLVPRLGEWRAITMSLLLGIIGYAAYGLITEGWMVYPVIIAGAIGGIGQPALQGVMSRIVPPNAQGELQGAMTSLQSLSMVIGPLVMSRIFAGFSGEGAPVEFPGAPFMLASVLTGLALVIALGARRKDDGSANETTPENEPSPVSPREAE